MAHESFPTLREIGSDRGQFQTGQHLTGVYPRSHHLQPTFRLAQHRQANYRQWSERATIVSYDQQTQSYDIVVTAVGPTGNGVANTNRALRKVKSLIPDTAATFSPGDSVLVGYVSEQREHPIILGAGDHVAPRSNTPIVSLPSSTLGTDIEGPKDNLDPENQPACPFKIQDPLTGSTSIIEIDCSRLDANRNAAEIPQALCGVGNIDWQISGITGATIVGFGVNKSQGKITLPTTNINVGGAATRVAKWHRQCTNSCNETHWSEFGCNDQLTQSCFNETAGSACLEASPNCAICHPVCSGGGCPVSLPIHDDGAGVHGSCDSQGGAVCDKRSQSMKDQGCRPCLLADGATITGRDSKGNVVVMQIKTKKSGVA